MTAGRHVLDPWLIAGSSFYWTSVVLSFMFSDASTSPAAIPSLTMASYAIVALFILLVPLFNSLFVIRRRRRGLAVAMLAVLVTYVLEEVLVPPNMAMSIVLRVIYLAVVACQMVLWGFAYASLEKTRACQNVCCTVMVAVFLVLGSTMLAKLITLRHVPQLLNMLASCILISGKVYFSNRSYPPNPIRVRSLTPFVTTRFAFGFCIGFCMQVPQRIGIGEGSSPYIVLGMATSVAVLLVYLQANDRLYSAAPSMLIIGIVVLFLPFLQKGEMAASALSAGFVWLAWATLSAAQLSELKEPCGMSELTICVTEKSILSIAIVGGAFAYTLLGKLAPIGSSPSPLGVFSVATTWFLILVAICNMASLVSARKEDEYRHQLQQENQERSRRLYQSIADEFGLSEREKEIVELLSEGYSRTYIKDALCISEGTVKAHVAHVYQKLGIHRKDDLLDLVEARRKIEDERR